MKTESQQAAAMAAPQRVHIDYRICNGRHVFSSADLPGFDAGHHDLEIAFAMLAQRIDEAVTAACGRDHPPYVLNKTYRELLVDAFGPRRDPHAATPLFAVPVRHAHIEDPHADFVPPARRRREALARSAQPSRMRK